MLDITQLIIKTLKFLNASTQPGSYGFHIGDAVSEVEKFKFSCEMFSSFLYLLKIEIIGAALQQDLIISQSFGAAPINTGLLLPLFMY